MRHFLCIFRSLPSISSGKHQSTALECNSTIRLDYEKNRIFEYLFIFYFYLFSAEDSICIELIQVFKSVYIGNKFLCCKPPQRFACPKYINCSRWYRKKTTTRNWNKMVNSMLSERTHFSCDHKKRIFATFFRRLFLR